MTRKNDTFIELKDRGKIANSHNADLFISIHANAAKRKSAKGIETYYLGSGSSEQARETAERENGDLVHSVADDAVQEILASLSFPPTKSTTLPSGRHCSKAVA